MIINIDKTNIFSLFKADNFDSLEYLIDSMPPSLVEYHLMNFISSEEDCNIFFNKKNIQSSFSFGIYSLYLDYEEKIYLEFESDSLRDTYTNASLF